MFKPECRDERIGSLSLYGSPEDRNWESPKVPYFTAVFERLIPTSRRRVRLFSYRCVGVAHTDRAREAARKALVSGTRGLASAWAPVTGK